MGSVLRSLRDKNSIFIDEYFMGERRINESKCRECRRWRGVLCFWRKYLQVSFKSQRMAYRLWLHRSLICSCRRTLHSYIIQDLLKAARRKPTPSRKAASSKRRDKVFSSPCLALSQVWVTWYWSGVGGFISPLSCRSSPSNLIRNQIDRTSIRRAS